MTDNATVVREDLRNTGGDKYETTAREIQICRFSTFCSKWRMTFRKVTPAALKVNVKKFWQVLLVPWHVWAPIWVHFAPWWSIFPVKNRFSHIFPAPEGSPYQSLFLRYEVEKGLRAVSSQTALGVDILASIIIIARVQLSQFHRPTCFWKWVGPTKALRAPNSTLEPFFSPKMHCNP